MPTSIIMFRARCRLGVMQAAGYILWPEGTIKNKNTILLQCELFRPANKKNCT